jgi:hypothetical protein
LGVVFRHDEAQRQEELVARAVRQLVDSFLGFPVCFDGDQKRRSLTILIGRDSTVGTPGNSGESGAYPLNEPIIADVAQALYSMSQQTSGGMIEQGFCADSGRRGNRRLPALFRVDRILASLDFVQFGKKTLLVADGRIALRCHALFIAPKPGEFSIDSLGRDCRNLLFERIDPPAIAEFDELLFDLRQF